MKPKAPQGLKPPDLPVAEMLTPSELEQLRQQASENDAYFRKAFEHLRPSTPMAELLTLSEREQLTQQAKENSAYFQQAFEHLRPKQDVDVPAVENDRPGRKDRK